MAIRRPNRLVAHPGVALALAAVFSGAAALTYETIWTRALSLIVGSTVQAASATFAAFLVGIALGAFAVGRLADRWQRIVRAYVAVEIGIAITAPAIGLALHHGRGWLGGLSEVTGASRALATFATVLLLVLLPTLFMGATFPLLMAAGRRAQGTVAMLPRLYGFNTLGAAVGTLVCGFVLIRFLGVPLSLGVAALLNLLSAAVCAPLAASTQGESTAAAAEDGSDEASPSPGVAAPEWMLLAVALVSGLLVLGCEVVWSRLASYFLGNRTYAFTTLLACVLVLLALGSWIAERLLVRFARRGASFLGWLLVAGAAALIISTASAWQWINVQESWEAALPSGGILLLVYRGLEATVLLAPPMLLLGCLFPLCLASARQAASRTGDVAGRYYLINAVGAVAGSLGVGFVGMSTVGAFGSILTLAFIGLLAALAVFVHAWRRSEAGRGGRRRAMAGMATAALALALSPSFLPPALVWQREGDELLFRREDAYGVMQVVRTPRGRLMVTNNKTELVYPLGGPATSFVQEMQGHLGMFFQPRARRALVLCSGYGLTSGALTAYQQLERIDAVEILPGMVAAADLFEPFNAGYHRHPKVRVTVDDARHFLVRADEAYDLISINVSDPHLPGGASLFHREFYALVKQKLRPGGVVLQHAFGSDQPLVLRTLAASFAHVRLFRAYANGFNVVAADDPLAVDDAAVQRLVQEPAVATALARIGILPPISVPDVLAQGLRPEDLPELFAPGPLATDDHPLLEFAWSGDASLVLFSNE